MNHIDLADISSNTWCNCSAESTSLKTSASNTSLLYAPDAPAVSSSMYSKLPHFLQRLFTPKLQHSGIGNIYAASPDTMTLSSWPTGSAGCSRCSRCLESWLLFPLLSSLLLLLPISAPASLSHRSCAGTICPHPSAHSLGTHIHGSLLVVTSTRLNQGHCSHEDADTMKAERKPGVQYHCLVQGLSEREPSISIFWMEELLSSISLL